MIYFLSIFTTVRRGNKEEPFILICYISETAKEKHFFIVKLQRKWELDGGITVQRAVKQKS